MAKKAESKAAETKAEEKRVTCGIVMPISAIDDCSEDHWRDVRTILEDSIEAAEFEPRIVSRADQSTIIHRSIIQNLYKNEIVVVDVSCKNANVMFELGLRLAFDRPTVVVKDTMTDYSFDTQPIEHLEYPRSLRHGDIEEFKTRLRAKIRATHEAGQTAGYSMFLRHFAIETASSLDEIDVSATELILKKLDKLEQQSRDARGKPANLESPNDALLIDQLVEVRGNMIVVARSVWEALPNTTKVLLSEMSDSVVRSDREIRYYATEASKDVLHMELRRLIRDYLPIVLKSYPVS